MKFNLFEAVLVFIAGVSAGAFLMSSSVGVDIANNTVKDYHCAPIQKASTITEAKRIVSRYQEGVK